MATATIPRLDIFPGVTLRNIEWEDYCKLRDDPAHDRLRMTYLDGDLTIMSPRYCHDNGSRRIFMLVIAVATAWRIRFLAAGTTTLRRKGRARLKGAGKEPDDGFYLGDDVARIKGKDDLDLAVDPPPNLAIEVDNTGDSEAALPAHARIRVPEVWIYKVRERSLWFGRLAGEDYEEIGRSIGLPRLTPTLVLEALEAARAGDMDDLDFHDWLQPWARALPGPPGEVR